MGQGAVVWGARCVALVAAFVSLSTLVIDDARAAPVSASGKSNKKLRPGPWHQQLACKRDSDCVYLLPPRCVCGPCGKYWPSIGNKRALQRQKRMRATQGPCVKRRCAACWRKRMTAPLRCVAGQCIYAKPTSRCRRDRDCVLLAAQSKCRCAPCGRWWRQAVNKRAARAWRAKQRKCATKRLLCPSCVGIALGKKARCIKRQCVPRR